MSSGGPRAVQSFFRLLLLLLATATILLLAGYFPTRGAGGIQAVWAMFTGCAVSFLGSVVGGIPLALGKTRPESARLNYVLGSLALRFLVVLGGVLLVVLTTPTERTPFLLWVVLSYLTFLAVDSFVALRWSRVDDEAAR